MRLYHYQHQECYDKEKTEGHGRHGREQNSEHMQNEEVTAIHVRDMTNAASVITLHTIYKQPHAQIQGRSGKQGNSHYLEKEKRKPQEDYECGTCGNRHADQECPAR